MDSTKRIIIIAGPNGVGKTTFAQDFLPEDDCLNFVNADLIARGLSPFNPDTAAIRAGRLMLEEIDNYVDRGDSFAIETTLSGRSYVRRIREWRSMEYHVHLVFLQLKTVTLAIERVAQRVKHGGHNIPEDVIRRRFEAGRFNFSEIFSPIVNSWARYDNSGPVPVFIDSGENL